LGLSWGLRGGGLSDAVHGRWLLLVLVLEQLLLLKKYGGKLLLLGGLRWPNGRLW